jgi:hypothetical protein
VRITSLDARRSRADQAHLLPAHLDTTTRIPTGRPAAISACRLLPRPEIKTAMRGSGLFSTDFTVRVRSAIPAVAAYALLSSGGHRMPRRLDACSELTSFTSSIAVSARCPSLRPNDYGPSSQCLKQARATAARLLPIASSPITGI